jgi:phosphoribosylamine--glycine ligase
MQELMVEQPPYDKLDFKNGKQKSYEAILDRYGRQTSFVKANGLADGKGVIGADNSHEIEMAIQKLRREYPQATDKILIERGIVGEEFSAFAICAGGEYRILGYAQDHKRAFDGDKGPNTGGMGAVSNPLLIQEPNFINSTNEVFSRVLTRMKGMNKTY